MISRALAVGVATLTLAALTYAAAPSGFGPADAPARSNRQDAAGPDVQIQHDAAAGRYAVSIGGRPFTMYRHGADFRDKPVFYPVLGPNGARVNREYPMVEGVPGESADHPHHQSLFFTYDEVNGTNFWNPDPRNAGRHIEHLRAAVEGRTLVASLAWKDKDGQVVLDETKRVTFGGVVGPFAWQP